tara:strand:+ start:2677 stop:2808 length:132 start_codon:yes stop_codon:yes gene_type:complete
MYKAILSNADDAGITKYKAIKPIEIIENHLHKGFSIVDKLNLL